jgi:hypothetical protein
MAAAPENRDSRAWRSDSASALFSWKSLQAAGIKAQHQQGWAFSRNSLEPFHATM